MAPTTIVQKLTVPSAGTPVAQKTATGYTQVSGKAPTPLAGTPIQQKPDPNLVYTEVSAK